MFWRAQPDVEAPAAGAMAAVPRWASLSVTVRTWGSRAFLSVVDHGVSSGANFALNLVLARVLDPPQYGAFSLAFVLFLFMAGFQNALILEPMAVLGPVSGRAMGEHYFAAMGRISLAVSVACASALAVGASGSAGSNPSLSTSLLGLSLCAPCILLYWFLRRVCYVQTRPGLAVEGSILYALAVLVGVWRGGFGQHTTPFGAFVLIGAGSLLASLRIWIGLGWRAGTLCLGMRTGTDRRLFLQHWSYGKWSLGTALVYWGAGNLYVPILALSLGLSAVAAFRAVENCFVPMSQVLTALGTLLLPQAAKLASIADHQRLRVVGIQLSCGMSALTLTYCLGILTVGTALLRILYGNEFYSGSALLMPFFAALLVIRSAVDTGLTTLLRAMGRPDVGFWSNAAGSTANLTIGIVLVHQFGLLGALSGWVVSAIIQAVLTAYFFARLTR